MSPLDPGGITKITSLSLCPLTRADGWSRARYPACSRSGSWPTHYSSDTEIVRQSVWLPDIIPFCWSMNHRKKQNVLNTGHRDEGIRTPFFANLAVSLKINTTSATTSNLYWNILNAWPSMAKWIGSWHLRLEDRGSNFPTADEFPTWLASGGCGSLLFWFLNKRSKMKNKGKKCGVLFLTTISVQF